MKRRNFLIERNVTFYLFSLLKCSQLNAFQMFLHSKQKKKLGSSNSIRKNFKFSRLFILSTEGEKKLKLDQFFVLSYNLFSIELDDVHMLILCINLFSFVDPSCATTIWNVIATNTTQFISITMNPEAVNRIDVVCNSWMMRIYEIELDADLMLK
jgi:hypothetical protein